MTRRERSARKKKLLACLILPCVAAAVLSPVVLAKRSSPTGRLPDPPWSWKATSGIDLGVEGPAAIMYVDRACIHCSAELDLWEAMTPEMAQVQRWVVASPKSAMDSASWAPPSLRLRTVHDADGAVAEALGVTAVPVTFWMDARDTIRFVVVGRTSRRAIIASLQSTIRWHDKE